MLDIATHRAWEDMKALLLYREDRERRQRGEPPLEEELAQEERRARETFDPQPFVLRIVT